MAQSVNVSGEGNQVNVVGRDLVFANAYVHEKPEFYRPNLTQFKSGDTIRPRIQPSLVQRALSQNVLVLGGASDLDKLSLVRHVAWDVVRRLPGMEHEDPAQLPVLEWVKSSTPQRLAVKLEETSERTVFVLPDIEPQHINYDVSSLHKVAHAQNHHVIISTEMPRVMWQIGDKDSHLWQDLPTTDIYESEDLFGYFLDQLFRVRNTLPTRIAQRLDSGLQLDDYLEGKMRIIDIIQSLKTPDNISFFIQLLSAQQKELSEEAIEEYINYSQNNQDVITRWFHQFLNRREQMLAVGLCFFDGLIDDQFFAALEEIIQQDWQHRDQTLLALDYHDLDKLQNFVSFADLEGVGRRIEIRTPEQRQIILKEVWRTHRRQIIAALPILASLVRQSVGNRSFHPELYGRREVRRQLRLVIGDLLSDLGRISPSAVETTLLELAADEEPGVQAVAGRAMARWYEHEHHELLSDTLNRWQNETRFLDIIESIFQSRQTRIEGERAVRARAYIRSTVALTVGYAAAFDPPNQISQWLIDIFKELATDTHPLVRQRFSNETLRNVVGQHPLRLKEDLKLLTRYVDLIQPIAASLAWAFVNQPENVRQILQEWEKECIDARPSRIELNEITRREALYATVILVYGEIRYEDNSLITAKEAVEMMGRVLNQERHPFVREAVAVAIARLSEHHFNRIEEELRNLVEQLNLDEVNTFVDRLSVVYEDQRRQLRGGDDQIKVKNDWYDIWLDSSERPRTSIEAATAQWLGLPKNRKAYSIAIRAREAFLNNLVLTEVQRAKEAEQRRLREEAKQEEPSPTSVSSDVVHDQLDYRGELRRLNALRQNKPEDFKVYMNELRRDDPQIAKRLEKDLRRMQWGWKIWIVILIGAIIAVTLGIFSGIF